ncbi:hypothetical protein CHUAL_007310 [Chamberlinius hualienensis]
MSTIDLDRQITMCLIILLFLTVCSAVRTTVNSNEIKSVQRCLPFHTENVNKHYLYIGEQTVDIRVEVTDRITHRLASHVLQILLKEVVGYVNVSLVPEHDFMNPSEVLDRVAGPEGNYPFQSDDVTVEDIPKTMISLEVWMGPGFSTEAWTSTKRLEHCGPLGPVGRFGWFIPHDATLQGSDSKCRQIVSHWKALQDDAIAKHLDLSDDIDRIIEMTKTHSGIGHHCSSADCINGIYYPSICKHNKTCAVLLARYPAISKGFISHLIESLMLKVKVAWIGAHLDDYIYNRTLQNKPVMFFSWKPNEITYNNMFTNIAFPACEDLELGVLYPRHCGFEINQLNKVAWTGLQKAAPEVMHVIRSMTFTQAQYQSLLESYINSTRESIGEVACKWVRNNRQIWSQWMPANLTNKMPLYIGGIFPLTGLNYRSEGIIPAVQMAVEAINNNNSVLKDFDLNLLVENGQCSVDHVMKAFVKYVSMKQFSRLIGILGPACSDTVEPLAGLAKHYHALSISYSAEGSIFYNKNFPYFFRTIPSNMQFKYVYLNLFKKMGWTRVATLTEEGMKYPEYLSLTQDFLQSHGINFVVNRKVPKDRTLNNMTQYLEDLKKKNVRIIIGDFYDEVARAVVCEAYRQQMTAHQGYVWFFPRWFSRGWFNQDEQQPIDSYSSTSSSHRENSILCTKEQMMKAVNGYMSLSYSYFDEDDKLMQENIKISEWKKKYFERLKEEGNFTHDDYASYAYDATWVFALGIDKLLKYNHTHIATLHTQKTANKLVEIINETDFQGVSGRLRFVGPSRISIIYMIQFINNESRRVGQYIPLPEGGAVFQLNESSIVWLTPDKKAPKDGEDETAQCALEPLRKLLDVECEVAIVIVNIVGFGLFAVLMLSCFIFIRHRYEKRVKLTELRMQQLGLIDVHNLHQWEIQRDFVVINRKIGEGAFGTVYGGEVFFENKGWVPVAVKTLKIGSAIETKADFLSEAEMMKELDHSNIVKLLGVCTRGEPVYTIMEFMLYGDLKTYLLARRHMVSDNNAENRDEVSDKRLTCMAMDVARGLSYLNEMKFVHRDIACRNCLVNSNRMIKIGDFGMTRSIYNSDYYQIGFRKAMLPVRWMAPESLKDGISTPMSDVWSYGVLVYEIITFGSFPFQGLSNNQVLDFVSKGHTLNIPRGCKPEMEQLLKHCWAKEPIERPTASEIVETLANNPRLLSPCLDIPLASVEMEGTGSLELQLTRRFSLSQKNHPQPPHPRRRAGTLDSPESAPFCKPTHPISNGQVIDSAKSSLPRTNKALSNKTTNHADSRGRYATLQYKEKGSPSDCYKTITNNGKQKVTSL